MAKRQYNIKWRDPQGEIQYDSVTAHNCIINDHGNLIFKDAEDSIILAYHPDEWLTVIDGW